MHVTIKDICLEMEEWPTVIMGDGCNVNLGATDQLTEYLGLHNESITKVCCSCHRWIY